MRWQDISLDGTWAIPAEDREKGNAGELVLPEAALAIIRQQPRFAENPHVFAGRGGSHLSGYSKSKVSLDAKVAAIMPVPQWGLHDLRRTARSLLARVGVRPDIDADVDPHPAAKVEAREMSDLVWRDVGFVHGRKARGRFGTPPPKQGLH